MNIDELIKELQQIQEEHGDLSVQIVRHTWQRSSLPSRAMGGGGAGWASEWCGTVSKVQVSKEHPDQLEIIPTK